ncbi:MAG: class I SAM-dependent methyltransferase [Candidatus Thorarchaeota archaeon]|jgi:SAM-dependent methyltransferase
MSCIICEKARDEIVVPEVVDQASFSLYDGSVNFDTDICMCPTCGYTFLDPPVPADALEDYYANQSRWPTKTMAYKEQKAFLDRYIQPNQKLKVLDIGAYDGRLLSLYEQSGADVYGVEPDLAVEPNYERFPSIEVARSVMGSNSVNIVTLGHVFEHLQDPFGVLASIKQILVPGGLLFIEVPDLEDPQIQVVPYWTPFHQSYFTPMTLGYMLEVAGYQLQALEKTGYRSIRIIARNFSNMVPNWDQAPPPQYALAGINKYLEGREALLERLTDFFVYIYPETLAIFGTGDHTRWLLEEFPDILHYTVCFLNSDPAEQGKTILGLPVYAPEDCPFDVDSIICSSYDSQDEMAQAVGKRARLLYEDVRAYDVWLGEEDAVQV